NSGGALGGTGSASGVVSVASGGHIAPGFSIGSITLGALNLAAGSLSDIELAPLTSSDRVFTTGNLAITSGALINLFTANTTIPFIDNGTFSTFDAVGGITINGSPVDFGGLNAPTSPSYQYGFILNNSVAGVTYTWGVATGSSSEPIITLTVQGLLTNSTW